MSLRHCHDHPIAQQMRHQTLHRSCLLVNQQMRHRNNQQMLHLYHQRMRLLMNQQMLRQMLRLKGQHTPHHLVNLPSSQLMTQPMNPPINQHANHHINQHANHHINQPMNHPTVQPVSQPASLLRFHLQYHRGVHPQQNRHLPPHHMRLRSKQITGTVAPPVVETLVEEAMMMMVMMMVMMMGTLMEIVVRSTLLQCHRKRL